jgi:II/X family phage/plasmid replication protein
MELVDQGLDLLANWIPVDGVPYRATAELLFDHLGDMTMTTVSAVSAELLSTLRPALKTAVLAWEAGADLRATLSRRTFYRYRAELLPHGIDIATLLPKNVSNVVPLHRVLEAKLATVPDWAHGTPLYFDPPPIRRRIA